MNKTSNPSKFYVCTFFYFTDKSGKHAETVEQNSYLTDMNRYETDVMTECGDMTYHYHTPFSCFGITPTYRFCPLLLDTDYALPNLKKCLKALSVSYKPGDITTVIIPSFASQRSLVKSSLKLHFS